MTGEDLILMIALVLALIFLFAVCFFGYLMVSGKEEIKDGCYSKRFHR